MEKLAIVCCYGVYNKQIRTSKEMIGLQQYYNAVDTYLKSNQENFAKVVYSGGYTNFISYQAESITAPNTIDLDKVIYETTAFSAPESIVFSLLAARAFLKEVTEIVIICDTFRVQKVQELVTQLIGNKIPFQVKGFYRPDIHPNSTLEYQTNNALPQTLASPEFQALKIFLDSQNLFA
jgi:hypothetical protein